MTRFPTLPAVALLLFAACSPAADTAETGASTTHAAAEAVGQESVVDTVSQPNVVRVAVGSKDHTTLVAALKAADLVSSLANAGPFTVFAPTNAAFEKLPAGTVETLLKPENKLKLKTILHHHVTTSALDVADLEDGQELGMVDGVSEKITKKDGATYIGGAKVIASVRASNGWVHIVDGVLVPPSP